MNIMMSSGKRWLCLWLLTFLVLGGSCDGGSAEAREASSKRRWRVIVIVPETHLSRPRIPDPAVETEVCRQLIEEGYKVIDQDRIKELRDSAVMDRIREGGPQATKEAVQLGRRFGADLFITGEAFTQEVSRQTVETDLGPVVQIRCRARVELKGIRMDSGEKFYAGSIQKTGSPEPTEELASKACLEQAASSLCPEVLDKCAGLASSEGQHVELEVRGVGSISLANQLTRAIEQLPGVLEIDPGDYDARTYFTELYLEKSQLRAFAGRLETTPALKRFRLRVESSSGTKIVAYCK